MKNWKWFKVLGIVIIFVMGFGFIGCDPDDKNDNENTKDQSQKIYFGTDLFTIVSGNMTDTEWGIAILKLTNALNEASTGDDESLRENCEAIFNPLGPILIELENVTQGYSYYKISSRNTFLMNVNFVLIASANDLFTQVKAMINAGMGDGPTMQ